MIIEKITTKERIQTAFELLKEYDDPKQVENIKAHVKNGGYKRDSEGNIYEPCQMCRAMAIIEKVLEEL